MRIRLVRPRLFKRRDHEARTTRGLIWTIAVIVLVIILL